MPKESKKRAASRVVRMPGGGDARRILRAVLWRLDRLERQVKTLSELVRDHAEDADRLVRIVAEDHEVLRKELLSEHQARLRRRKARQVEARMELTRDRP